jgi:hypothetical protein
MPWAMMLRDADEPLRALSLAYELVRKYPNSAKIALGYIGLIIGSEKAETILGVTVCDADCAVVLTSQRNERHAFIIDDGGPILGVETVSRNSDRAARVLGKSLGAELEEDGPQGQKHVWKLTALASKYVHVLHVLMNEFQIRYPGAPGIWRLDVEVGDIKPVLDMVRDRAEANRAGVLDLYIEKKLPLALVGRSLGADELWLAQYLRNANLNIATCAGVTAEIQAGVALTKDARGAGAVLDTYAVWVCAQMGLLEAMKSWFGTLLVSQSTIDRIDDAIAKHSARPGREAMSLDWQDGQFIRHIKDNDYTNSQIETLDALKAEVLLRCEIVSVAMPDDVNETVTSAIRKFGSHPFESIYLAAERGFVLVSDDLHYRSLASASAKVRSVWIQAFLIAARQRGDMAKADYARHLVQLAHLRHNLVQFDAKFLIDLFESSPDPDLVDFTAVCRFFGGADAAMWGHALAATAFLGSQWSKSNRDPRLSRASSILLGAILREREDWSSWLALVFLRSPRNVADYLLAWTVGHFLPLAPLDRACVYWRTITQANALGPVSRRASFVAEFGVGTPSVRVATNPTDKETGWTSRTAPGTVRSRREIERRRRQAAARAARRSARRSSSK